MARKPVTTNQRVFSALVKRPRIITDTEEVIVGDSLSTCVVWNNLIGLNFTDKNKWEEWKDHLIHNVRGISRHVKQVAIFDEATLLHKVDITTFPCKIVTND